MHPNHGPNASNNVINATNGTDDIASLSFDEHVAAMLTKLEHESASAPAATKR
jgi:hypothetical protein